MKPIFIDTHMKFYNLNTKIYPKRVPNHHWILYPITEEVRKHIPQLKISNEWDFLSGRTLLFPSNGTWDSWERQLEKDYKYLGIIIYDDLKLLILKERR